MLKNAGSVLKQLLQEPGIQMAPGVYDGISARVVEQAGFRAGYIPLTRGIANLYHGLKPR